PESTVEQNNGSSSPVENPPLELKTELPLPVSEVSPPIPKCTIRLAKKSTSTWTVSELKALMNQSESSNVDSSGNVAPKGELAAEQVPALTSVVDPKNGDQQKERQQQEERQTPGASEVTTSSVPADRGDTGAETTDDNRWDDYCSVCQNGGDLICCEAPGCSRVFHCGDHIPQYENVPKERFVCGLCTSLDELRSELDNIPPEQRSQQKLTPYEHKICEKILLTLYCHADSIHFQNPVDALFFEYYERIKRPMDFSKIRRKLASKDRCYKSIPEFIDDLNQVFINCCLFNKENTETGRAGIETGRLYKDLIKQYCPKYLDLVKCTVRFEKRRSNNSGVIGRRRTNHIESDDEQQEQETCKRTKSS
uniref:Bromo domain-containing protein n=1 Tax=Romanomermis culicivorax TaxID=13658 RepID=A0A915IMV3_ROMCU